MTEGPCSICGGPYINHGNNAAPWEGRACNDCDNRFVTPARMFGVIDADTLKLLAAFALTGRHLVMMAAKSRSIAKRFAKPNISV